MACSLGHQTCLGPTCTQPSLPNRPLIGKAREKQELQGEIKNAINKHLGGLDAIKPRAIVVRFYSPITMGEFLQEVESIRNRWWLKYHIGMAARYADGRWYAAITMDRVKQ